MFSAGAAWEILSSQKLQWFIIQIMYYGDVCIYCVCFLRENGITVNKMYVKYA